MGYRAAETRFPGLQFFMTGMFTLFVSQTPELHGMGVCSSLKQADALKA